MPDFWQKTMAFATEIRRALHQQPELTWAEEKTAGFIRQQLTELNIPWRSCARTGTVATIYPSNHQRAGKLDSESPVIALRADIDGLPVQEASDVPWASASPGSMHACGHDGHTAALLAVAACLKYREQHLPSPVVLIFQPAEEGGHGAREMINDGVLEGVSSIFGWHNWPALPLGQMVCPDGIVMAGNGTFEITLTSSGGHASQPETTGDTILAASAVTLSLQQIVARRLPPQAAAVVSVTSIDGISGPTVIPGKVALSGSIRVPDSATRQRINALIPEIASQTAASYGVAARTELQPRYEATINHAAPARQMRESWSRLYGETALAGGLNLPVMASEDFSYYLNEIPGAFALIGAADSAPAHQVPLHSARYDFNDALIPQVTRLFADLTGTPFP